MQLLHILHNKYSTATLAVTLSCIANTDLAGSLGYTGVSPYMEWEPDCYKPDAPYMSVYDASSFNNAVDEFNYFLSEAQEYLSCILDEAEADIETTRLAIQNGFEDRQSSMLSEVDDARSQLESARYLID